MHNANSLKQRSTCNLVASLRNIMLIPRQPEFNLTEGILPLVAFPCWQQSAINEPHRWCIAHFECGRIGVVMFSVLTSSVVESVL